MTCQNCQSPVDSIATKDTPPEARPDEYERVCHLGPHDTGGLPVQVYHT